jgi:hypothetical protein
MIAPPRPPSHDELEALIKEARERQQRRRLIGAASVAVIAAVALGAYALTIGGQETAKPTDNANRASAALCRTSQLSAASYWNGAAGTLINFFSIVNRRGSACSLPHGRPVVDLSWRGSLLSVQESLPSDDFGVTPRARPVHVLAPGAKAAVYMQWSNWCGQPRAGLTTTVTLLFHGGLRVTANHVPGQPPCLNRAQPSVLLVSRVLTAS